MEDPYCNPNKPVQISPQDVLKATFRIRSHIRPTACSKSRLSDYYGIEIFLKKEFQHPTGSFKERGACNTLKNLSDDQKSRGVIAASAGNHALALAYYGRELNIPVTVIMPLVAPIMKVENCRQLGATVLVEGNDLGEAKVLAMQRGNQLGLLYVNGYDHPDILAGQGTCALEILEQVPNCDAIVVPVGGAGLLAGIATLSKALNPRCQVIGVESTQCPSFTEALTAGAPTRVAVKSTLGDGLAVPLVGCNAFATAAPLVDRVILVNEDAIALSILRLIEVEKAVVEGGGAVGLAAILSGELDEFKGRRICCILTGGNIDTTVLGRCIDRGLAADGRLIRFTVTVSDRPGGIADMTNLLRNHGASVKDIYHERAWLNQDVFSVEVKCVVETKGWDHSRELIAKLRQRYSNVVWPEERRAEKLAQLAQFEVAPVMDDSAVPDTTHIKEAFVKPMDFSDK